MNLAPLMRDSVTVETLTGKGTHGDPTYSAGTTVACRLQRGRDRREEITHDAVIYSETAIAVDSRVTLSDGTARIARRVYQTSSLDGASILYKTILAP